ncbi:MAG TPA: hypothetical protein VJ779_16975 [Acetobacteraceae bacterium]|nr:hypothetical protein [Acetobacteraceae bacterium]
MKTILPVGLVVIGLTVGQRVRAADWTQVCASVGHFASLVAVQRDQSVPANTAVGTARRILNQPGMITDEVGNEIARQVYETPRRSPAQEEAALRTECLTPAGGEPSPAASHHPHVVALAPIELNAGPNYIANFAPDGRGAVVTLAWHDDGGGHGHDVFTVTVAGAGPVTMPGGSDAVRDDPNHDSDMLRSVRFARGRVDGAEATLLLTATRQSGSGPTPTRYRVFRLARQGDTYGFVPVLSEQLPASCNADMALSVAAGLPVRRSYRGAATANGCPKDSQIARQE